MHNIEDFLAVLLLLLLLSSASSLSLEEAEARVEWSESRHILIHTSIHIQLEHKVQ